MKLNKEIKNPKWKNFFKHDENNIDCKHCKFQKAADSIPQDDFKINELNDDGTIKVRTVKEVTLVYGQHEDVIGWTF